MTHWLQALAAVATGLASWRWVVRPLRRTFRELLALLRQIRDASGGVQLLGRELHALAGSFVSYALSNHAEIGQVADRVEDLTKRHAALAELYIDVAADVSRIDRATRRGA